MTMHQIDIGLFIVMFIGAVVISCILVSDAHEQPRYKDKIINYLLIALLWSALITAKHSAYVPDWQIEQFKREMWSTEK